MSPAAAPLRQTRRAEKEERILDAALAVFSSAGYAGASMDAIAEAAGVSKPTLYQYFGAKEALFARIMERGRDQMLEPFGAPGQAGAGMVARLHAFAWAYADCVMQPAFLSLARLVIGEVQRFPGLGRAYQAAGPDRVLEGMIAFLEEQRAAGRLDFEEGELAAQDLWALILSAPRTRALHEPEALPARPEISRYLENGLRVFLRAYSTDPRADLAELEALLSRPSIPRDRQPTGTP